MIATQSLHVYQRVHVTWTYVPNFIQIEPSRRSYDDVTRCTKASYIVTLVFSALCSRRQWKEKNIHVLPNTDRHVYLLSFYCS